jgi:streptogramin lyase
MSEHFQTRLQLQLREAAQREERRGALGRLRLGLPAWPVVAAGALATVLLAALVVVGGLRWGGDEPVTAPHVVAVVPLADNLGSIDAGFGSVWIADTAKGQVLRVDPRTRQVGERTAVGGAATVTAGAGAVWALSARGRLLRIDPATSRVTDRVPLRLPGGGRLNGFDVQMLGGVPWAIGAEGAMRINARDGHVEHFTRLRHRIEPFFVIASEDSLWVVGRDQRLVRYDLATGRREGDWPVPIRGSVGVTPTQAGPVYATHLGEVARADPADGRLAWRRKLGTGVTGIPYLRGSSLWIHASNAAGRDRLVELDLASGHTRSSVVLPEFGASGVATVGRQLWITTPNGKVMVLQH